MGHAGTPRLIVHSMALAVLLLFVPNTSHAAIPVSWIYIDPGTGEFRYDAPFLLEDGGTQAVPFHANGSLEIDIDLEPFHFAEGEVFFIPNPDEPTRERVDIDGDVAWEQEGVYEIDIYDQLVVPVRSPWERFMAWLVPVAYAQENPFRTYIETIRFTVTEGPPPAPPCCSSVLFLPGIEGSALKEGSDVRWPSSLFSSEVARLALTEEGESVNDIQVAGVLSNFVPGVDLYGGFASYMDELSTDEGNGTIQDWVPFAYDWRFSLEKTLEEGAFWESEGELVNLVHTVENLASESKTGKVTIVAHSMGGLLAKALIKELEEVYGEAEIVDSLIMVGTPQLGTPEAIAALLHGREPVEMELFVRSHIFRSIVRNMGSAHALLPSQEYFNIPGMPAPITFNTSADFTEDWRNEWGTDVDTFSEFHEFLTGTGSVRERPSETNLAVPEVLREDLVSEADIFHSELDQYELPSHLRVVQIAGWGLPTLESIEYKKKHLLFDGYEPHFTREGDITVVYPSALSSEGETYYLNLNQYRYPNGKGAQHRDLLSTEPVHSTIDRILRNQLVSDIEHLTDAKPNVFDTEDQLLISTKSPVVLGVLDSEGNFTGVDQNQDTNSEALEVVEEIPGSTFIAYGDDQYIFLPKEGSYTFKFKGTGSGPATVETSVLEGDTQSVVATHTDIPVTSETEATFVVDSEALDETLIEVDTNGDGTIDASVTPDGYVPPTVEPTVAELIGELKVQISNLDISQKLKNNLLKRIGKIEQKIEKQKQRKSKVLERLKDSVNKNAGKGNIDATSANEVTSLVNELEESVAIFPLNPDLIQELRTKVTGLTATTKLKNNLLKRIDRLEKMTGLLLALERLSVVIGNKVAQGKIPDTDAQELLNLLSEIEGAL